MIQGTHWCMVKQQQQQKLSTECNFNQLVIIQNIPNEKCERYKAEKHW